MTPVMLSPKMTITIPPILLMTCRFCSIIPPAKVSDNPKSTKTKVNPNMKSSEWAAVKSLIFPGCLSDHFEQLSFDVDFLAHRIGAAK